MALPLLPVTALRQQDAILVILSVLMFATGVSTAWEHAHLAELAAGGLLLVLVSAGLWWRWPGQPWARWVQAAVAMCLAASPLVLSGGQPEWLLVMMLALSVLPTYRDWRKQLVFGGLYALGVGLLGTAWGEAPALDASRSLGVLILLAHTAYLSWVSRRGDLLDSERFDLEFLIKAMGKDGPIRLNFDAVRAESPMGRRLKHIQDRMAEALRQVEVSTQGVHGVADVLKDSGAELMQRTESSANGLRDAAMVLEQITVIVKSSAEAALEARGHAQAASDLASNAGGIIEQVVDQMRHIDASARRITDIIGVIDGIAFQTNILALNAAVEAARAGEQGRGFAVVAAEVRSLAQRSAGAAKEIKQLIGEALSTVEHGNALADSAGTNMQNLVQAVQQAGDVFRSLSADTDEHANSIEAVTQAVKDLDELTRQNVSVAERADEASRTLSEHAHGLTQVLGEFRISHTMPPPVAVAMMSPPVPAPPLQRNRAPAPPPVVEMF